MLVQITSPQSWTRGYDAALGRSHYVDTKELSVNKKPIKITYSSDSSSDTHDDNSEIDSNEYDSNTSHSSSHSSDDEKLVAWSSMGWLLWKLRR